MKSSARLVLTGILGCVLIAGCDQTREVNIPNPPAASYQVKSFELQESAGKTQQVRGASVTPLFFQSVKAAILLGRGFLPAEYAPGTTRVVMVSHRLWQERFSSDPGIIGTTMRLDGQAFTLIGVMPTGFDFPSGVDLWVPKASIQQSALSIQPEDRFSSPRHSQRQR